MARRVPQARPVPKAWRDRADRRGPQGERGEAGAVGDKGEPGIAGLQLRQVRQECAKDRDCTVTCGDGEVALNAVCPAGAPQLRTERMISCGSGNPAPMTAFCAR